MRKWVNLISITMLLLAAATAALADVPDPSKHNVERSASDSKVPMVIARDYKARDARLVIPRSIWQKLQAEAGADGQQSSASVGRSLNLTGVQTAIAGLFLSLALVFGGLWFVRTRKRLDGVARTAIGIGALALLAATGSLVYANAGPPPAASRSLTTAALAPEVRNWGVSGQVTVTISDQDNRIILYLPDKR